MPKVEAVVTVTIRISESLLKRAQAITGRRNAVSAVRRALEIATHDYELNEAARRVSKKAWNEDRKRKVLSFDTASGAVAHLKSL